MVSEGVQVSSNKLAIINILGGLIKNPLLFSDDNYSFSVEDFPERFHKIVFGAIEHLAKKGLASIGPIDIDEFLRPYTSQYMVFCEQKGVDYLRQAIAVSDPGKFDYYYQTLKKHSLINAFQQNGIDTKDIYDPDIVDPKQNMEMQKKFDELSVNDILLIEETKIILTKEKFGSNSDRVENAIGDSIDELIDQLKETPVMGLPLMSPKLTTIYRGIRKGCVYMTSAASGSGKALPNSVLLPTPYSGHKRVGDIEVGNYLFDSHGNPTRVEGVFKQGVKDVYLVKFLDGRTAECCIDHLWGCIDTTTVNKDMFNRGKAKLSSLSTKTLLERGLVTEEGRFRFLVPQQGALHYVEREHTIPVSEYVENVVNTQVGLSEEYLEDSVFNREQVLVELIKRMCVFNTDRGCFISNKSYSPELLKTIKQLVLGLGYRYKDIPADSIKTFEIDMPSTDKIRLFSDYIIDGKRVVKTWAENNDKIDIIYAYNAIVDIVKTDRQEEMTCFLVDNIEHLFLTQDCVVTHNTRLMVGDAVHLAIPEYYDTHSNRWVKTGLSEKVLLVETELELSEIQTMVLACVSGISENKLLDGAFCDEEEKRLRKAAQLIKESSLYMVAITNYNTDDLINTIKKYYQVYGVEYVFYDYLSENMKILAEGAKKARVSGLRTDQILLSMITALKDCAKQLGIFISTATQVSGDYKNAKELDSTYLRAAKSLSDKADVGAILTPVREIDQPVIDAYCSKGFELIPNFVLSVYKIRRGSYQNIKVYIYFDRSTCRVYDTFVTDSRGTILPVEDTSVEILLETTKEEKFETAYAGISSTVDDIDIVF